MPPQDTSDQSDHEDDESPAFDQRRSDKKSVVALGDTVDDGMDSDDSDSHQVQEIVSRLGKKAEEQRQSRQKGKRLKEDDEEKDEFETPKSTKKRGLPPKSTEKNKKEEATPATPKSAQPGLGRGRLPKRASSISSAPGPSLRQGNNSVNSPLKRKSASKAGAEGNPRRSARAAAIADKAAKAKAADDKKANETQNETPAPKRTRRNTAKKSGVKQKGDNQESDTKTSVYVVEKIVGHRIDKKTGVSLFEVKWKGYPKSQNTWEPKDNLKGCAQTLKDYLAEIN
ncbi:hypothetical protein PG996_014320 [Apiospora saccharicola]|uniref:Chromo domain-containing protein n=1 Tax=Apiospora saccharicola TaxID=335842 RepID=A0ABR1TI03_9PEZI